MNGLDWGSQLAADTIHIGSIRTRASDSFVTDSAAAATAYASAVKTYNGGIGVDGESALLIWTVVQPNLTYDLLLQRMRLPWEPFSKPLRPRVSVSCSIKLRSCLDDESQLTSRPNCLQLPVWSSPRESPTLLLVRRLNYRIMDRTLT